MRGNHAIRLVFAILTYLIFINLACAQSYGEKPDRSKLHQRDAPEKAGYQKGTPAAALKILRQIPASGKVREAGFDGKYGMESTTIFADLDTLCAQGSRGIIMLTNDTWQQCGGKPSGASKGPGFYPPIPPWNKAGVGEVKKMNHAAMGH